MKPLVLDASVITRALLPDRQEPDQARCDALWLLAASGEVPIIQPAHWLAELCGVLARLSPDTVEADLSDLCALEIPIEGGQDAYVTAASLAVRLERHAFDTLYHAVAIIHDGYLVTADHRYLRAAGAVGHVASVADFSMDLLQ